MPDLEHYRRLLVGKPLELPNVRDGRSGIAIQTLKTDTPLPLGHFDADGD